MGVGLLFEYSFPLGSRLPRGVVCLGILAALCLGILDLISHVGSLNLDGGCLFPE